MEKTVYECDSCRKTLETPKDGTMKYMIVLKVQALHNIKTEINTPEEDRIDPPYPEEKRLHFCDPNCLRDFLDV